MYQNEENTRIRGAKDEGKLDLIIELVNEDTCSLYKGAYYANMEVEKFKKMIKDVK